MSERRETARFRTPKGEAVEGFARCEVDGSVINPCHILETVLTSESRFENSVLCMMPMVSRTRSGQRDAVTLRFRRSGLAPLDFCPFCGAPIKTTLPPEGEAPHG